MGLDVGIYGIGTDIVDIVRIKKGIERYGAKFTTRIFTDSEITYCESKNIPAIHYAGRFAAKEAFIKILDDKVRGFRWRDIEILNTPSGKPYMVFSGFIADFLGRAMISDVFVSISHEWRYAVAFVIATKDTT